MDKIINPGSQIINGKPQPVYVQIKFDGHRLSITGVVGPWRNGDCAGSCGQIIISNPGLVDAVSPAWTRETVNILTQVWDEWHLNDMRPGSPDQQAWLKSSGNMDKSYVQQCALLAEAGLNPDKDGYVYGSAWRFEPVPDAVLRWLDSLPESATTPAWV